MMTILFIMNKAPFPSKPEKQSSLSENHMDNEKKESVWLNLGLNLILPSLLLIKGVSWSQKIGWSLSPTTILIIALAFPLGYGIYDRLTRRKWNFFSILGLIGVLFMGGIGVLELPKEWVPIKEAAIPGAIGITILFFSKIRAFLIKTLLYSHLIFNISLIESKLKELGNENAFKDLLKKSSYGLGCSFLMSAVINYILAVQIVVSETGTEAFLKEIGKMNLWSYVFITIPFLIVFILIYIFLVRGIKKLTGLSLEDLIMAPES